MPEMDEDSVAGEATIDDYEDEMAKTIISDDDIEVWRARRAAIDGQIAALIEEKALLDTAIEAWRSLQLLKTGKIQADEAGHDKQVFLSEETQISEMTLTDAARAVLKKYGTPMRPGDIMEHIKDVGFTRSFGRNYFYTCIGKAVDKGLIGRRPDGRYSYISGPVLSNGVEQRH